MVNELPFNHIILFFIFFLGNIVPKIHSYINFTYPYGISLSNGNIFVIHKFGICICDQNLSTIIQNVTDFTEDEELTAESSLRIVSTYEYEHIIAIINYKLYIINNTWNLVITDNIPLNNIYNDIYFSITPIFLREMVYYYLISYVDIKRIKFLYYGYSISNMENDLIYNSNEERVERNRILNDIPYYIENNSLSCQYMNQIDQDFLICFYLLKHENITLMFDYFCLPPYEIWYQSTVELYQFNLIEPKYIKSIMNSDRDKALICVYSIDNKIEFFEFDINDFDFESYIDKYDMNNSELIYSLEPFNRAKINYLKEKKDFIFSFNDESSIKLFFFSGDFNNSNITTFYKQDNLGFYCSNINDHVIFYSNNTSEYYVLPFAQICDPEHLLLELLHFLSC